MILGLGSDITDARRIAKVIERHGDRFLTRIFTDIERAKATLQMVRPDAVQDDAIRAVEAEIRLRENPAPEAAETVALRARLAADPKDHQARYDLAMALDAAGDRDAAVNELLELVRLGRKWNEEAGRKQLVTLFEAMGPTDPRTLEARRKLSGLLFS